MSVKNWKNSSGLTFKVGSTMEIETTDIPGCFVLQARKLKDARGNFTKLFHEDRFRNLGLRTDWCEEYFTVSEKDVVRGMHFQTPPADHAKVVFCLIGSVIDVVVDLRRGSPAFGRAVSFELSAENSQGIYIPTGCAHGFVSMSAESGMYYKVTSVHSPDHDAGIAWNSIDFGWPVKDPIISERDVNHPQLAQFDTPFIFNSTTSCQ